MGVIEGPSAAKSLAISHLTEYVVGAFTTEGVGIYNAMTGELVRRMDFKGERCIHVDFNHGDTELLIVSKGLKVGIIRTFDFKALLKKGEPQHKLEIKTRAEELNQASYGYLNDVIFAVGEKGSLFVFDSKDGSQIKSKRIHESEIFSFTFSPDFTMLATCSKDFRCHIIDPYTLEILRTFNKLSPCRCASFSPFIDSDGAQKFHVIIGGGQDAKDVTTTDSKKGSFESRVFNILTEDELGQIKGHFGPVHSIKMSPDGRSVITASEDGTIRLQRLPLEYFELDCFN